MHPGSIYMKPDAQNNTKHPIAKQQKPRHKMVGHLGASPMKNRTRMHIKVMSIIRTIKKSLQAMKATDHACVQLTWDPEFEHTRYWLTGAVGYIFIYIQTCMYIYIIMHLLNAGDDSSSSESTTVKPHKGTNQLGKWE